MLPSPLTTLIFPFNAITGLIILTVLTLLVISFPLFTTKLYASLPLKYAGVIVQYEPSIYK